MQHLPGSRATWWLGVLVVVTVVVVVLGGLWALGVWVDGDW